MPKIVFMLLLCLLLAGCEAVGRGIAAELLDESRSVEKSGRCVVTGYRVPGTESHLHPGETVKILMIHGIGTHSPGYSLLLQENLAKNLGLNVMSRTGRNIGLRSPEDPQTALGNLRVTFLTDEKGEKRILFYELTWSEITRPQKELLAYDYSSLYADRRVVFNRMMKKFLDNALPDAVYYIGSRRRLIQQSAEQAMCWMLKTDWQTLPDFQKGICLMSPAEQVRAVAAQKMLFITHSLGSKIFIDAFTALAEDMQKAEAGGSAAAVRRVRDKRLTVFMMANQLPLLHIWSDPAKVNGKIASYCRPDGRDYDRRIISRLNIVAFNDPDDLLTYAVRPDFVDRYIDSRICPRVTNVSVNVTDAVSAFGVGVVNPVSAHEDYDRSPTVIGLIGQGTAALSDNGYGQCRFIRLKSRFSGTD